MTIEKTREVFEALERHRRPWKLVAALLFLACMLALGVYREGMIWGWWE